VNCCPEVLILGRERFVLWLVRFCIISSHYEVRFRIIPEDIENLEGLVRSLLVLERDVDRIHTDLSPADLYITTNDDALEPFALEIVGLRIGERVLRKE